MLKCRYGASRYPSSGGDPGKSGGLFRGPSRRLAGIEDSGTSFNRRRAAAWMDGSRSRLNPHELESLDPGGKFGRLESSEEQADPWAAVTIDTPDRPGSGAAFGTVASGFWPKPGSLGRSHARRTPKTSVWIEDESAAGPEMDAPTGISLKTSQLFVSSGSGRGSEAVSSGVKKNFKIWGLGRRWFFRMRRGLACIPGWDGGGSRKDTLFASRRRANTSNVLICRGGWRRFWDASG
jgi:hypothetical protein